MRRAPLSFLPLALVLAACGSAEPHPTPKPAVAESPPSLPPDGGLVRAARPELLALVPKPVHRVDGPGVFALGPTTRILFDAPSQTTVAPIAAYLSDLLEGAMGSTPMLPRGTDGGAEGNAIYLALDPSIADDEGYHLVVSQDRISIAAKKPQGLFYAIETLRQLLPIGAESRHHVLGPDYPVPVVEYPVPVVEIEDAPRFRYRGLHLDTSRHFFPVAFIKKYLDAMAMYKLNAFHWHLTDDQGWRIEIKKYPKLTQVGGWRKETLVGPGSERPQKFDGQRYGGFYTQEDIRDVVRYAEDRFITVVPEIEMPGHSRAALAAYPELACTPGPFEVATGWGVFEDVYCPNDRTFAFLEDVLGEVIALFPGGYIHIGGDEVPKVRWKQSQEVQRWMKREHLKNEDEVQSYFTRRMASFIQSKGRRVIGWDEILEGGLAHDAIVMSWRGFEGGVAAAKLGHDVIMTPVEYTYFDQYQDGDTEGEPLASGGNMPVEKVYAFEPVPDALSPDQAAHVIGAQANVWTEYLRAPENVEYMVFPRVLALAEVLWTPKASRSWEDFAERLPSHMDRLDLHGITSARAFFKVKAKSEITPRGECVVTLGTNTHDTIHFTLDGSDPNPSSAVFQSPIVLTHTTTIKAIAVREGKVPSPTMAATYHVGLALGKAVKFTYPFSDSFPAAREYTLTNARKGSPRFGDGQWIGFEGRDLEATIDLGKASSLKHLGIGFLRDPGAAIMPPSAVEFLVSNDGKSFRRVGVVKKDDPGAGDSKPRVMDYAEELDGVSAQYVRVHAKNYGPLPPWHTSAGHSARLFADELIVE